jgi:sterol desaturase/sphingolipid hydroxylase (fatty acid hydroxylase superfamily)
VSTVVAKPSSIQIELEARKARRRLYPVSAVYTVFSAATMAVALGRRTALALAFYVLGVAVWTALEYWAHRYILHGRFPDGPGLFEHFLHRSFDHLHWEHHKRPWDGNHINGTMGDTLPFVGPVVLLSLLLPVETLTTFLAGLLQAYVVEEWVHHSVHFCHFRSRYFRYIKRHHLYHHSPQGMEVAFGLTNGFWDIVYQTRIAPDVRRALYERASERPSSSQAA